MGPKARNARLGLEPDTRNAADANAKPRPRLPT